MPAPTVPTLARVTPGTGGDVGPADNNFAAILAYAQAVYAAGGGGGSGVSPTNTATVAAGSGGTGTVHSGTGLLFGVLITTTGTTAMTITDGAAGTIIAEVQANAPTGWIPFPSPVPYLTAIYSNSSTGTPALTVSYA